MSDPKTPLEAGNYYHIYNRGINSCDIFREPGNYEYFLKLYEKHINPIADTYAWVLMPNHFHILIRIHDDVDVIRIDQTGFENLSGIINKPPHQHFSNLFNAYSKAYNKYFNRHGSLFERPFRRKLIDNEVYLRTVLKYIHNNPLKHGFCSHPMEYPWSSYMDYTSGKLTEHQREILILLFEDIKNFKFVHEQKDDS
ncbi:MAG: hypothetical protein WCP69_09225 [Bacteroidota bacterium]